jgi:hypothetical protein
MVTDALTSSLMAVCILLSVWLRQTSGIVLCLVHVVSVKIRRITLPQKSFTATYFGSVFMSGYNCWTKHEERGVIMEDTEEEEDHDNYPEFYEYGETAMGEDEEEAPDEPIDNLKLHPLNGPHVIPRGGLKTKP